tara:strand:+ start:205 stop:330 length:126 start_codon:yes stop_codon:yes gene_type:complete
MLPKDFGAPRAIQATEFLIKKMIYPKKKAKIDSNISAKICP